MRTAHVVSIGSEALCDLNAHYQEGYLYLLTQISYSQCCSELELLKVPFQEEIELEFFLGPEEAKRYILLASLYYSVLSISFYYYLPGGELN